MGEKKYKQQLVDRCHRQTPKALKSLESRLELSYTQTKVIEYTSIIRNSWEANCPIHLIPYNGGTVYKKH